MENHDQQDNQNPKIKINGDELEQWINQMKIVTLGTPNINDIDAGIGLDKYSDSLETLVRLDCYSWKWSPVQKIMFIDQSFIKSWCVWDTKFFNGMKLCYGKDIEKNGVSLSYTIQNWSNEIVQYMMKSDQSQNKTKSKKKARETSLNSSLQTEEESTDSDEEEDTGYHQYYQSNKRFIIDFIREYQYFSNPFYKNILLHLIGNLKLEYSADGQFAILLTASKYNELVESNDTKEFASVQLGNNIMSLRWHKDIHCIIYKRCHIDNPQNDNPQNDNPQNDNPQNDNPQNDVSQNNVSKLNKRPVDNVDKPLIVKKSKIQKPVSVK